MASRIEFPLESGGTVVVEGFDAPSVGPTGRPGLDRAAASLRASLSPVVAAASDVIDAFHALPRRPDGIEVKFGVALDAKLGAILASGTAGVHLEVTLKWSPTHDDDSEGDGTTTGQSEASQAPQTPPTVPAPPASQVSQTTQASSAS